MTLPTSAKAVDRFPIPDSDAVYLIEVPTAISKARYRRAMTALGTRIWGKDAMIGCARQEILDSAPDNQKALLDICNLYENVAAETNTQVAGSTLDAWVRLARVLQGSGGDFAARVADNEFWGQVAPIVAARCFLTGTEALRFKRGTDGLISEETLAGSVPDDHIGAIGWRALALFTPSEAETKNFASPQPSPSGPASSIAASDPSTAPTGSSSETGTSETQN